MQPAIGRDGFGETIIRPCAIVTTGSGEVVKEKEPVTIHTGLFFLFASVVLLIKFEDETFLAEVKLHRLRFVAACKDCFEPLLAVFIVGGLVPN